MRLAKLYTLVTSAATAVLLGSQRALAACDITGGAAAGAECTGQTGGPTLESQLGNITNVLILAVGVISIIMIIIGGFRYALSGGDSKNTTAAKDTILYAIIGLVVALLAYTIANFVIKQF